MGRGKELTPASALDLDTRAKSLARMGIIVTDPRLSLAGPKVKEAEHKKAVARSESNAEYGRKWAREKTPKHSTTIKTSPLSHSWLFGSSSIIQTTQADAIRQFCGPCENLMPSRGCLVMSTRQQADTASGPNDHCPMALVNGQPGTMTHNGFKLDP